jgi:hypothetical protein
VILEELPGVQQDLDGVGPGKDGEPANDRADEEMGEGVISEPVSCASHEIVKLGSRKVATLSVEDGVPTPERGNE